MVIEVFDNGNEPTPQERAAMQALMSGIGTLKYVYHKDGKVEVHFIPTEELLAPKLND